MKVTSISMTELEFRCLRSFCHASNQKLSRFLVREGLSSADDWMRSNGFGAQWDELVNSQPTGDTVVNDILEDNREGGGAV